MRHQKVKLGEVAQQIRGVTFRKGDALSAHKEDFIPVYRAGNIEDGILKSSDLIYLEKSFISDKQLLQTGDVLLSTSSGSLGSIAKAGYFDSEDTRSFGAFLRAIRPEAKLDSKYLFHFLSFEETRRKLSNLASGANINNLKVSHISNLEIPLPPLGEQRRIAAILDLAHGLRSRCIATISRLDSLDDSLFLRTTLTESGSPWPMRPIGDFVESTQYGTSQKASTSGRQPILRMGNISDQGAIDDRDLKYIDLPDSEPSKYTVRPGDILFNRTNSKEKVGKTAVVREHKGFAFAGYLVRIRLTEGLEPEYLSAFMRSAAGRSIRQKLAKSAVNQANINAKEMQKIPIPHPPTEVQKQFVLSLNKIESQRKHHTNTLNTISSLVSALQSRAFRGEL